MSTAPEVFVSDNPLAAVGVWLFCEFELSLVKRVEGGRITEVTDGLFSHSSRDLSDRCFPLEIKVKQISDFWEFESRKLHAEGGPGLNFPDIHRYLVETWADACLTRDDDAATEAKFKALRAWLDETWRTIRDRNGHMVGPVRLFGR